ncbi:MAG: hypothetical protein MJ090_04600 [Clostridia bacterium]|nr:hypothetical protein [Clostridia bacterium]
MKDILKNGASVFLRVLVVAVMSLIVTASIGVLCTAVFTDDIGYTAFVTDKEGKQVDKYTYYYADGEDTLINEYTAKGYSIRKATEISKLTGKGAVINNVTSQSISVIMLFIFIYNKLFSLGNADNNLSNFGHIKADKFKGLKIGLVAMIPSFILFVVIAVLGLAFKSNITVSLFTLPHFYIFQILKAIIGDTLVLSGLSVWQFLLIFLSLFAVPIVAFLSYYLGYKDILILEKIIYKKKKV